ncbi:MAG: hypothetical protein FWC97_07955 [Treponema sp.]|nr:hypothetical protein [Treponema sp.]
MRSLKFALCLLFSTGVVFAQPIDREVNDLWISAGIGTAVYSRSGLSYGGSLAFAYGRGVSVGLQTAYFFDLEDRVDVLELGFLLRFYVQGLSFYSGPFIQLSGGQALFFRRDDVTFPASWGILLGCLSLGWRFFLDEMFFIEPFIRGGYPYLFGGGLSAGIRF